MKNLLLTLSLMISAYGAADNTDNYNYTYYQMKDGLCDEYIFSVYEDSFGFIWFCTSNGLDRFDGNEFVHYSSASPDDSHRINSNFVKRVVEDAYYHLWIISDVGLMRIDLKTGKVDPCTNKEIPHIDLLSQPIQALYQDEAGNLWLGISESVVYVRLDNHGEIQWIEPFPTENNIIVSFTRQDNIMWAGGLSGICKYLILSGNQIRPVQIDDPQLSAISNIQVVYAYGSYLWIGTQNGLYCYNTQTSELELFQHAGHDPFSISGNNITSVCANKSGDIIIATRNGINIYTRKNRFEQIKQSPEKASINTDLINDIFVDRNGSLWVGTSIGGVNLITTKKITVNHLLKDASNRENIISRIYEDNQGNLFAGIINKGLAIRYTDEENFRIHPFSNEPHSLIGHDIRSIKQDYNNDYWIATSEGLNLLKSEDLKSPRFSRFTTENSSISSNVVYDLAIDTIRRGLWICHNNGIDFMDLETQSFTRINCMLEPEDAMRNLLVICLDSNDNLWLGGNGLYVMNLQWKDEITDKYPCTYYKYKLDDPSGKIAERISSIIETKKGDIYIGSQNNGLYIVEKQLYKDYSFRNLPVNHSPSNIKISNIQEDRSENLWISTVDGIFYFDTRTGGAEKFDYTDGIPINQFYVKSGCMLHNGNVCFGTTNGFLNLSLPSGLVKGINRKVVISHIRCDDFLLAGNLIHTYNVYPDRQSFEVFFSALRYTGQKKITYAYKIDGVDKKWNTCVNQNSVRYTNLPPGNYTLRVKCTNPDNSWSDEETVLNIKVHPSFYQTTWFLMLILFVILSLIFTSIYWYVRHQKEIQKYLKEEVAKRTQSIAEQNMLLHSQNQEINEQKNRIEKFSKQMEQANKEKLMLFTNLTHEFKTPLTLILGPTHKLAEMNKNPELTEIIQVVKRNAQYLLFLLNQIMDLRRVDAQQLNSKPEKFNITQSFNQDIADFTNLLHEREITLKLRYHILYDQVKSDKQFIHTIVFNLISNAIKYTPNGGTITVCFGQFRSSALHEIKQFISVHNTGSYIEEKERENIFDCFYKIENRKAYTSYGQSSTGIGLFLVRQTTQALNGHISLKSLRNKGTTFRVCFPVQQVTGTGIHEEPGNIPFTITDENKPVLLLVEDNRDMREYIKSFLEKSYNVAEAINGKLGFEMAKQLIPDFIISDMMMPEYDGVTFCTHIREEKSLSHIPFLMLTALSDDNARLESYMQGVDAFLTKPFEPQTLLIRIENILRNYKRRQKELSYDLSRAHSSVLVKDTDKQFLEKLTEIMEKNYANPDFNVADLLEGMGMSNTSFYKKIIALTGLSASHFIRLYRLQTAKKIIDNMEYTPGATISEIAYLVGFSDPKYFTRCFVKQYKVTPSILVNKK